MSTEEVKTPAQIAQEQRDKIEITSSTKSQDDENENENKVDENSDENNDDKGDEGEKEEKELENKEAIEESEKTEEELEAEKAEAKTAAEKAKFQRRIDREVAKREALKDENEELRRQLAAKAEAGDKVLTEEDVDKEAQKRAEFIAAQKEFVKSCNDLYEDASKIDKNFETKVNELADDIGPIPSRMIGILHDEIENGAAVLNYLCDNHDEAEKIYNMSPDKMGIELYKVGVKLIPKKEVKQVSKVPPPNDPIRANGRTTIPLNDKMTDKEWIDRRNADLRARGRH